MGVGEGVGCEGAIDIGVRNISAPDTFKHGNQSKISPSNVIKLHLSQNTPEPSQIYSPLLDAIFVSTRSTVRAPVSNHVDESYSRMIQIQHVEAAIG